MMPKRLAEIREDAENWQRDADPDDEKNNRILELTTALAESAMKWSKEHPTAAEHAELWWWRKSPHHKAAVQEVFRGEVWEDRGAVRTLAREWGGEWAGPLTPPS